VLAGLDSPSAGIGLPERMKAVFQAIFNSLEPGGHLVFGDHVGAMPLFRQLQLLEEAGFAEVDVAWRVDDCFVAGGRRPLSSVVPQTATGSHVGQEVASPSDFVAMLATSIENERDSPPSRQTTRQPSDRQRTAALSLHERLLRTTRDCTVFHADARVGFDAILKGFHALGISDELDEELWWSYQGMASTDPSTGHVGITAGELADLFAEHNIDILYDVANRT